MVRTPNFASHTFRNGPFSSFLLPLYQDESTREAIHLKMRLAFAGQSSRKSNSLQDSF